MLEKEPDRKETEQNIHIRRKQKTLKKLNIFIKQVILKTEKKKK